MTITSEKWIDRFCDKYGLQLYEPVETLTEENVAYFERKGDVKITIKIDASAQTITFYDVDDRQYFNRKTYFNEITQGLLSNYEHWDQLGFSISEQKKEHSYKTDMIPKQPDIPATCIEFRYWECDEVVCDFKLQRVIIGLLGVICTIGALAGIFYPIVKIIGIIETIKIATFAIGLTMLLIVGLVCICCALFSDGEEDDEE